MRHIKPARYRTYLHKIFREDPGKVAFRGLQSREITEQVGKWIDKHDLDDVYYIHIKRHSGKVRIVGHKAGRVRQMHCTGRACLTWTDTDWILQFASARITERRKAAATPDLVKMFKEEILPRRINLYKSLAKQ